MRYLVLAFVLLFVSCADSNQKAYSGNLRFDVICVDGVEYLRAVSYKKAVMSVKFNADSTVSTCE